MLPRESPLAEVRRLVRAGGAAAVAESFLARANGNGSRNTYLWMDAERTRREAAGLRAGPLWGVPISLKDCFDLAGTRTTFGSKFYAERNPVAAEDSAVAARLRACGAVITGKTHLQALAYGITGQNADFGDCVQPRDAGLLTGGSSSGAAASVQEGSAVAAIGTDTGGSVRVPAALCGLMGYRASHDIAETVWPGMWRGSMALAQSFDTLGVLFRDPRDGEELGRAIFGLERVEAPDKVRIGCFAESYFHDATAEVLAGYAAWRGGLEGFGAEVTWVDPAGWPDGIPIFTAIQAHEASRVHAGYFGEFGELIEQRLHWGASISVDELAGLRVRHAAYRKMLSGVFADFDFLMLPAAPVGRLRVDEDQSATRAAMLRYTVPFSLGRLPAVTLPGELIGGALGSGVQVAARMGEDAKLLGFVRKLGEGLAGRGESRRGVKPRSQMRDPGHSGAECRRRRG